MILHVLMYRVEVPLAYRKQSVDQLMDDSSEAAWPDACS